MPAPYNNTNAEKEETLDSFLHIRTTKAEKAQWVQAAKGQKLAKWVRDTLNRSAKRAVKDHQGP